jgi:LuxR family maltose regulon positive regulatory protein
MNLETVKYHTKSTYKKLGVSGKAEAVLTARDLGLL